jgi:peptidoglycan/LPS O-acetylase OafA/YrhL
MELKNVNILRGIAALAVVYFHLSGSADLSAKIASSGKYGFLGVELFFVISGFILPYSMYKSGYHISSFFIFMAKRIVRIYPCYVVLIIAATALMIITKRPVLPWPPLFSHLFFLNGVLNYPWISPVFWTLALEFQFYMIIGLFYKAIISKSAIVFILFIGAVLALSFVSPGTLLPQWFGMFALGIVLFRKMELKMSPFLFWTLTVLLTAFIAYTNGPKESMACLGTLLAILYIPLKRNTLVNRIGLWVGSISYSLYLTHWEFGRLGVAVFRHLPFIGSNEYLRLLFGLCLSILIAWLFHVMFEKSSVKLSQKIKYIRNSDQMSQDAHANKAISNS